jgi:membrane protease YdiL (CAAX protease family)
LLWGSCRSFNPDSVQGKGAKIRHCRGVAVKGGKSDEAPLKALGQILLYLAATVLIGALLAPPLFWIAQATAGQLDYPWLKDFVAKTELQRYFDRAILIAAIALLWPLLKALGIKNFGDDLGLVRDGRGWQRLALGFVVALASVGILGAILLFTGVYRMHSHIALGRLAWLPVTAITVALLEEFLFRGALHGAVRKTTVDGFALVSVSALYAMVHFLKSPAHKMAPAVVHWWSGFALLPDTLVQFRDPALLLGGFTTLFTVGLILGFARERTRSLWMPVGLHAGWVLGNQGFMNITGHTQAWPWVGPDVVTGLAPVLILLATWGIVWWMTRGVR